MLKDLRDLTRDEQKRSLLIADCVTLIDSEVKSKSGISGFAVKTAYKIVKALKPSMMENTVDALLDDFADVLQGHHQRYQEEGCNGTLEQYLSARSTDVAEGLLQVTDKRANRSTNKTIVKAYNKLRPKAKEHVDQAVPGLGRLVDKHVMAG